MVSADAAFRQVIIHAVAVQIPPALTHIGISNLKIRPEDLEMLRKMREITS